MLWGQTQQEIEMHVLDHRIGSNIARFAQFTQAYEVCIWLNFIY
jgi:hypothetical protein